MISLSVFVNHSEFAVESCEYFGSDEHLMKSGILIPRNPFRWEGGEGERERGRRRWIPELGESADLNPRDRSLSFIHSTGTRSSLIFCGRKIEGERLKVTGPENGLLGFHGNHHHVHPWWLVTVGFIRWFQVLLVCKPAQRWAWS